MAIIDPWNVPININSYEHAIKGNMIKYEMSMSEYESLSITIDTVTFYDEIKKQLLYGIMDEIMRTKSIEFTKMKDYANGTTSYRARMFAVPDDQVRILRLSQVNNKT